MLNSPLLENPYLLIYVIISHHPYCLAHIASFCHIFFSQTQNTGCVALVWWVCVTST